MTTRRNSFLTNGLIPLLAITIVSLRAVTAVADEKQVTIVPPGATYHGKT